MDQQTTIQKIETTRTEFVKFYQILPVNALESPDLSNGWAIKNLISHISSWEGFLLDWLKGTITTLPSEEYIEAFNDEIYQTCKDWSWEEVEYQSKNTYQGLLAEIKSLPAEKFEDSTTHSMIAACTYNHYTEHHPMLERYAKAWQSKRRR